MESPVVEPFDRVPPQVARRWLDLADVADVVDAGEVDIGRFQVAPLEVGDG